MNRRNIMPFSKEKLFEHVKNHYQKDRKEKNVLRADCQMIIFLLDNCEIFIPEENIDIAREAIESKNTSLASTVLTCVIIIAVGSILVFSMPKILTVINGWLSE